jgi:uncharacterized protein (DUF1015 family)
MSALYPFRALRPAPEAAARVASVPYDVVSADEARALVAGEPLSFLRVTRAEVDVPPGISPYDPRVYAQAVRNFEDLTRAAPMVIESEPSLYVYRLRMGGHTQTGLAGCFAVEEYDRGLIKKHEKTRPDKEDDRTRHLIELRAQTGVVFLTYRASVSVDTLEKGTVAGAPLYDVTAPDGVQHELWRMAPADVPAMVAAFATLPALYIADGHHRAASASRARAFMAGGGGRAVDAGRFVAVAFPDRDVRILAYHRVVKNLAGHTKDSLIAAVEAAGCQVSAGPAVPDGAGAVSMFLGDTWRSVRLPTVPAGATRAQSLDVEILQRQVLEPVLGVGDPRQDKRIDFVGGIRGTEELERLVNSGQAAVAFALYPVTLDDLMVISDEGGIMPPKSTWFEPKLRDGWLTHLI